MKLPDYILVNSIAEANKLYAPLLDAPLIGLDSETFFDPKLKRMRLSLLQIAHADEPVILLDARAIDPEPARELLESADTLMAAHNARFDQGVLLDAGFASCGFVDTLSLARRALRLSSYSLASVAAELFGEMPDKSLQKSDWYRRPLTPAQLGYAALDARLTLRIFEALKRRLEAQGIFDEALRSASINISRDGGERKSRVRRAARVELAPLNERDKAIVNELRRWRLDYARANHLPAYMICSDKTLEHLAQSKPATLDEMTAIYGLGAAKVARFGEELLLTLHAILRHPTG